MVIKILVVFLDLLESSKRYRRAFKPMECSQEHRGRATSFQCRTGKRRGAKEPRVDQAEKPVLSPLLAPFLSL